MIPVRSLFLLFYLLSRTYLQGSGSVQLIWTNTNVTHVLSALWAIAQCINIA